MTRAHSTLNARLQRLGLFLLFTAVAILTPCSLANAQQEPLRVQLLWEHQGQFAGFYVAEARRHFEATPIPVYLSVGLCLFTILGLKIIVHECNIKYPRINFLHRDKAQAPGDDH